MDPSRVASDGLKFSPPNAHAMESSTDVLPWLFLPPMTVRPFAVGSSFTALIRLTFSISSLLIFTDIFLILLVFVKVIPNRPRTAAHFVCNLFIGPSCVSKRRHLSSVQLPFPALSSRAFRGGVGFTSSFVSGSFCGCFMTANTAPASAAARTSCMVILLMATGCMT